MVVYFRQYGSEFEYMFQSIDECLLSDGLMLLRRKDPEDTHVFKLEDIHSLRIDPAKEAKRYAPNRTEMRKVVAAATINNQCRAVFAGWTSTGIPDAQGMVAVTCRLKNEQSGDRLPDEILISIPADRRRSYVVARKESRT